jgi:hypothetical protein
VVAALAAWQSQPGGAPGVALFFVFLETQI